MTDDMLATDDTLIATGARNVLRMERRYPHPPAKVWRAITEPEQLGAWFPFPVELVPSVGGAMRFGVPGDPAATAGVVTALEEPRLFEFDWGGDLLRFELERDGDAGCRLVFTHTFDDHHGAASFAAGWRTCQRALAATLDGRSAEPSEDINALHERYVDQFELGRAVVERNPDGWTVRLERQLTQPGARAWELLVGERGAASGGATPGGSAPDGATAAASPPAGATIDAVEAGRVLAVEAPRLLEYEWASGGDPAGTVRWELGAGTGHGARLVLTQTGPLRLESEPATAAAAWEARVEQLAARLAAEPRPARG